MRISTFGMMATAAVISSALIESDVNAAITSIVDYSDSASSTYIDLTNLQPGDVLNIWLSSATITTITTNRTLNSTKNITADITAVTLVTYNPNIGDEIKIGTYDPSGSPVAATVVSGGGQRANSVTGGVWSGDNTTYSLSYQYLVDNGMYSDGKIYLLASVNITAAPFGVDTNWVYNGDINLNYEIVSTPEAASLGMLGAGALLLARRRK